ncbi:hypothetical protein NliqN6_1004 [Naganishia liquefaciens]|uniref:C2H2-type domain-containing protein n=1 Tax=Naganishia liquefaciens TaxID=104408 RepID=A0A8H3TP05_9TREE|nr:hypothetical protein NliqN6_1004 [Naganishia liquefaciens]
MLGDERSWLSDYIRQPTNGMLKSREPKLRRKDRSDQSLDRSSSIHASSTPTTAQPDIHTDTMPNISLPPPPDVQPRPLTTREAQLVDHLVRLQLFLATGPGSWQIHGAMSNETIHPLRDHWESFPGNQPADAASFISSPHPALNRFLLPNGEHVSCVYWNGLYQITGTDIVRALAFRFEAFGRPVRTAMIKKFEEGVFSDLRNLKPGEDASLEKPKAIERVPGSAIQAWMYSDPEEAEGLLLPSFLPLPRFSVPHDRLFLDALERDLKREKDGLQATTEVIGEPARSFRWDPSRSLFEQFAASESTCVRSFSNPPDHSSVCLEERNTQIAAGAGSLTADKINDTLSLGALPQLPMPSGMDYGRKPVLVSLFEGAPAYKQRKKKPLSQTTAKNAESKYSHSSGNENGINNYTHDNTNKKDKQDHDHLALEDASQPESCVVTRTVKTDFLQAEYFQQEETAIDRHVTATCFEPTAMIKCLRSGNNASDAPACVADDHPPEFSLTDQAAVSEPVMGSPPSLQPNQWKPYPYASGDSQPIHRKDAASPMLSGGHCVSLPKSHRLTNHHSLLRETHNEESTNCPSQTLSDTSVSVTTGRMFQCPLDTCGRLFKRLEHLKRHVRTHTQERPYVCTHCRKRFSRSDNLTQHLKIHDKVTRNERGRPENDEKLVKLLEARVETLSGSAFDRTQFGYSHGQGPGRVFEPTADFIVGSSREKGRYIAQSSIRQSALANRRSIYPEWQQLASSSNSLGPMFRNDGRHAAPAYPYTLPLKDQNQLHCSPLLSRSGTRSPPMASLGYVVVGQSDTADMTLPAQRLGRPRVSVPAFRYSPYSPSRAGLALQGHVEPPVVPGCSAIVIQPSVGAFLDPFQRDIVLARSINDGNSALIMQGPKIDESQSLELEVKDFPQSVVERHGPLGTNLTGSQSKDSAEIPTVPAYEHSVLPANIERPEGTQQMEGPESPEALAFSGMLVTASYEPAEAADWPSDATCINDHQSLVRELLPPG